MSSEGGAQEGRGVETVEDFYNWNRHEQSTSFQYIGCSYIKDVHKVPINDGKGLPPPDNVDEGISICLLRLSSGMARMLCKNQRHELLPSEDEGKLLLSLIRKVISRYWMFCAKSLSTETGIVVRIDVFLSNTLWNATNNYLTQNSSTIALLSKLRLRKEGIEDKVTAFVESCDKKSTILSKVFSSLPKHKDLVSRNFIIGNLSSIEAEDANSPGLWEVPGTAVQRIVNFLDSTTLRSFGATCKFLHSMCCTMVPGLTLQLYRHQKVALFWMLGREGNPKQVTLCPGGTQYSTADGFHFWIDYVGNKLYFLEPECVQDCRGGLLCDEPGMGKTVTVISLILRTKSSLPKVPQGCTPVFSCPGSRKGFYEVERNKVHSSTSKRQNSIRTRSSSSKLHDVFSSSVRKVSKSSNASANNLQSANVMPKVDEEERTSWVQCDGCKKWRIIRANMVLDTKSKWFCKMSSNLELQRLGCNAPEQTNTTTESTCKTLGYISFADYYIKKYPDEENINYFSSILTNQRDSINNVASAIHFLANISEYQMQLLLGSGLVIPSGRREPDNYSVIFDRLGLARKSKEHQHTWSKPQWIGAGFIFDQTALKVAIHNLSLTKHSIQYDHIFLSSATLIVAPTHLIAQWKAQIDKCCRDAVLKVFTYDEKEKEPSTHELAWNFDIVLTTFQRLSTEWSIKRKDSVLMQIHWFRIVLDEGHQLGSSLGMTNKLQMACAIRSERRWIMTGTPTPETVGQGAAHLLPLLKFLHEPQYGLQPVLWNPTIQRPLEGGKVSGAKLLTKLLGRFMIRASKSDLESIPDCHRATRKLHFDATHAKNYNEFVAIVQRNLLLADWWDTAHVESLLHASKLKEMMTVIRNIRLSCNLAGHMKVDVYGDDIRETMMLTTQMHPNISYTKLAWIERAFRNGGHCQRCGEYCRVPVLTPRCAHILCVDCTSLNSTACSLCKRAYAMENGQFSPERQVPFELIELQPSYIQADFYAPAWITTSTVKTDYLMNRLKELNGQKVIVFSQFQEHLRLIEEQLEKKSIMFAGLFASAIVQSAKKMKAIRMQALQKFEFDKECQVLLMDGICSHGLDLKFCSHVILMEPIWDMSLEEQVISRAHRMGQRHEVHIETLTMSKTIEEEIMAVRNDSASVENGQTKDVVNVYELRKRRWLLSHLHTISVEGFHIGCQAEKSGKGEENESRVDMPKSRVMSIETSRDEFIRGQVSNLSRGSEGTSAKRVKFADSSLHEDGEPTEEVSVLLKLIYHLEMLRSKNCDLPTQKAEMEIAIETEFASHGKDAIGKAYKLLVSAWWPGSVPNCDIPLFQKEGHPRYTHPQAYEISKDCPTWIVGLLAQLL